MTTFEINMNKAIEEAKEVQKQKRANPIKDFIVENKKLIQTAKKNKVPAQTIADIITLEAIEQKIIDDDKKISAITITKYMKTRVKGTTTTKSKTEGK